MVGGMHRLGLLITCVLLALPTAAADAARREETALVDRVIDGQTLQLRAPVAGAREVRLGGIEVPQLALGRPGMRSWPLAEKARQALAALAEGRRVRLLLGTRPTDRYGRLVAQVFREDGLWLQGEMLRRGLARVHTFVDTRARAAEMLAMEKAARSARRGIWALRFYAVRSPDDAARWLHSFQLVEGRITGTARRKGWTFLNFGADWRTDFTVAVERQALPLFAAARIDPLHLDGKRVRVRGWVKDYRGPMIEVTHPEQIEVLADEGS